MYENISTMVSPALGILCTYICNFRTRLVLDKWARGTQNFTAEMQFANGIKRHSRHKAGGSARSCVICFARACGKLDGTTSIRKARFPSSVEKGLVSRR